MSFPMCPAKTAVRCKFLPRRHIGKENANVAAYLRFPGATCFHSNKVLLFLQLTKLCLLLMSCFRLLTTLGVFFISASLFAQKKSLPGYYITLQGDTIKGVFPRYAQWSKNPSQVEFSIEGTTNQIRLTPQNAHKFVVEGYDEYLSYSGRRLVNPIEDAILIGEQLFFDSHDSIQQVSLFLRLVKRTTGGDLYILNDALRMNFFYRLPGQQPTELRYKKTLVQNQINEMPDFRQQLSNAFAEIIVQKNLTSRLEKLRYEEENLSSFFQALFPAATIERKTSKGDAGWVVSVGAALNRVSVQAGKDFNFVPRNYASSFSPLLSAGFIIPMGRNFGKFFFYPQAKLFRYKNTGEENQGTFINSVTYKTNLAAIAELGAGVNVINQETFRVFLRGGMGMLMQVGAKQVKQLYAASDRSPYLGPTETELASLTYSISASTGVELNKKILFSATYMVPTNIGKFVFYSPELSGVHLQIAYKL